MPIKLTCSGCGHTWQYGGKKRPIPREGKPDKAVRTNCPKCGNNVPIRAKDVQEHRIA